MIPRFPVAPSPRPSPSHPRAPLLPRLFALPFDLPAPRISSRREPNLQHSRFSLSLSTVSLLSRLAFLSFLPLSPFFLSFSLSFSLSLFLSSLRLSSSTSFRHEHVGWIELRSILFFRYPTARARTLGGDLSLGNLISRLLSFRFRRFFFVLRVARSVDTRETDRRAEIPRRRRRQSEKPSGVTSRERGMRASWLERSRAAG